MSEHDEQANPNESWDAFWDEITPAERYETIRGVTVPVPRNLPLRFTMELESLRASTSEDDIRRLVGQLFGDGTLDTWLDKGMTAQEFAVVLAWGIAQGQGEDISFRQAYEIVRTRGKSLASPSPNGSNGTGGRSKRTSSASTGSRRTR